MSEVNWYVVHTYSGYENKVKANIEKTIENRHLEDQILEVRVPMEEVVEVKNGTKKQVLRKLFPGYVLINMIMNDDTWYVVRNTRGVTGFVGPGSKPGPLTDDGNCGNFPPTKRPWGISYIFLTSAKLISTGVSRPNSSTLMVTICFVSLIL